MSKLKAISGHEIREDIDYNTRGIDPEDKEWHNYGKELCDTLYYRKSEVDKVIAKLEERIADGDKDFVMADNQNQRLLKIVRHQKRKRCLARAYVEWLKQMSLCYYPESILYRRAYKRERKWKELAKKFKPNNQPPSRAKENKMEKETFNFGKALELLKEGKKVCRSGWNGKGMFLTLQEGSVVTGTMMRNKPARDFYGDGEVKICPHIDMKAADGSYVVGWLASQTDMLADDWMEA